MDRANVASLESVQKMVENRRYPRVTKESIEAKIAEVKYLESDVLTICIITMKNGFKQLGKAAPADPRNFDAVIGQRYAYEDAFKGLWALEGYLLCENLMEKGSAKQIP